MTDEHLAAEPRRAYTRPEGDGYLREALLVVLPALAMALVIAVFVAQTATVAQQSMEPALYEGQRLLVDKLSYRLHPPRRGDIVVFRLPGRGREALVKRVIGLPGETIAIRSGQVYANGRVLREPYLRRRAAGDLADSQVPAATVFVLGDNRELSNDSRYFGPVPWAAIIGRVCLRFWPLSAFGPVR